jgi:GNAT superfamily N-acetyltransferase
MIFREALVTDIYQMQLVRNSVKENMLSNPALVTDGDYEEFITTRGKGWVCETKGKIVGFAFADLQENNIWALFVHPDYENMGIGKTLHRMMLDWYFSVTDKTVWLGTAPKTRAESFYSKQGWTNVGVVNKGETKFEMTKEDWEKEKE